MKEGGREEEADSYLPSWERASTFLQREAPPGFLSAQHRLFSNLAFSYANEATAISEIDRFTGNFERHNQSYIYQLEDCGGLEDFQKL
ncbi:hypothetical protein R1flu_006602 [Riccia fluitans]|uniref:Uncharacterized protein n=1 Tax=Riccia fluitans TaxID=41844 RepID=A0ABD1YX73_9MARC